MFMTNAPTTFDITFRLFGFPIRIHPLFWLIMALLGEFNLRNPEIGPSALVVWVICGLISIVVHELGHAFLIRRYGSPTEIILYGFGGLAAMPYPPSKAWKRFLIALAGPVAGFILVGVLLATQLAFDWAALSPYLKYGLLC